MEEEEGGEGSIRNLSSFICSACRHPFLLLWSFCPRPLLFLFFFKFASFMFFLLLLLSLLCSFLSFSFQSPLVCFVFTCILLPLCLFCYHSRTSALSSLVSFCDGKVLSSLFFSQICSCLLFYSSACLFFFACLLFVLMFFYSSPCISHLFFSRLLLLLDHSFCSHCSSLHFNPHLLTFCSPIHLLRVLLLPVSSSFPFDFLFFFSPLLATFSSFVCCLLLPLTFNCFICSCFLASFLYFPAFS